MATPGVSRSERRRARARRPTGADGDSPDGRRPRPCAAACGSISGCPDAVSIRASGVEETREPVPDPFAWPASRSSSRSPRLPATTAQPDRPTVTPIGRPDRQPGGRPRTHRRRRAPVKLTVGLGYIPNVQFAQFYLADQAGYYRDAGLDVTFQNGQRRRPHPARPRRARSTSRSPTGRASSRRSARASRSATSRRSTPSSRTSCSPRRRPGSRPRPTSRAARSARRASTARAGSCSRACSTRPG